MEWWFLGLLFLAVCFVTLLFILGAIGKALDNIAASLAVIADAIRSLKK